MASPDGNFARAYDAACFDAAATDNNPMRRRRFDEKNSPVSAHFKRFLIRRSGAGRMA